ncbi:MAG: hypothetical protein QOJ20_1742, partial [Mycobacterium sp.]|nr:hypothetical protein [Mycobacterium sp.]
MLCELKTPGDTVALKSLPCAHTTQHVY